jgi:hypothetical protein
MPRIDLISKIPIISIGAGPMPRIDLISPSFNTRKYIHNDLEFPNLGRQHMKFEVEKRLLGCACIFTPGIPYRSISLK